MERSKKIQEKINKLESLKKKAEIHEHLKRFDKKTRNRLKSMDFNLI